MTQDQALIAGWEDGVMAAEGETKADIAHLLLG